MDTTISKMIFSRSYADINSGDVTVKKELS